MSLDSICKDCAASVGKIFTFGNVVTTLEDGYQIIMFKTDDGMTLKIRLADDEIEIWDDKLKELLRVLPRE